MTLNWDFTDTGEQVLQRLSNGALSHVLGRLADNADATITLTRAALDRLILGQTTLDAQAGAARSRSRRTSPRSAPCSGSSMSSTSGSTSSSRSGGFHGRLDAGMDLGRGPRRAQHSRIDSRVFSSETGNDGPTVWAMPGLGRAGR